MFPFKMRQQLRSYCLFHDMPKECEGWRCRVFGLAKQSVSFNRTVCFIKGNNLFLSSETKCSVL